MGHSLENCFQGFRMRYCSVSVPKAEIVVRLSNTISVFIYLLASVFYLLCPFITHTRTFSNLNYLPDSLSPFSLAIYCSINLNVNSDFHFHSECEWGLCKCFSLLKPQLAAVSTLSVGSHFGFSVGKHKHQAYAAWSATRHVRVFI